MKRIFLFLFPVTVLAQSGVEFRDVSWDEAVSEARRSNKLIFLHGCVDWSQPCADLGDNTFSNPDVGALFNASFINVSVDMEAYPGIELAEKYNVEVYPTLLFLDANENVVHRGCGALEPADLIQLGKSALNPNESLKNIREKYLSGDRSFETMEAYVDATEAACLNSEKIITDYFSTVSDNQLAEERNWRIIQQFVFDVYSREFLYLMKNQAAFKKSVNPEEVSDKIFDTFMISYSELMDSEYPLFGIKSLQYLAGQFEFDQKEILMAYMDFGVGEITENWEQYARGAAGFMEPQLEDPDLVLDVSWKFYLFVEDKSKLLLALNWTKYLLESNEPDPATIDTYASLLHKMGKKEEAIKFSEQALQLAKSWGEETQHYEHQLKKFKGGK